MNNKFTSKLNALVAAGLLITSLIPATALASSHREAPNIALDPIADNTDVYAFVSPDKPDTVTMIANFIPFEEPAGGPNFYRFGDDVLYEIKVDNTGDGKEDITYQFRFQTHTNNDETFLYNTGPINSITDPNFNVYQTYTVTKIRSGRSEIIGQGLRTPPSYVGDKSTPNYDQVAAQAISRLSDGSTVFAGQRDDPFFVDLGLFDLLHIRQLPGNNGGGIDQLKGYNVNSIAIQVPISELGKVDPTSPIIIKPTFPPFPTLRPLPQPTTTDIIGMWSTASRPTTKVFGFNNDARTINNWTQVSRLGSPLVNEVILPLEQKDHWNGAQPFEEAQFVKYFENPELGRLLKALYGINVPPTPRDDLTAVFLTGIPGLTRPTNTRNVVPSEMLRLNMSIKPTANPNPLGVVGGDNQGFPNGRRLIDDVTDIEIKAVAGAAYPLFHPGFTPDPLASKLGDGVNTNDVPFMSTFPYLAAPHNGFRSIPHATEAPSIVGMATSQVKNFAAKVSDFLKNLF